jgi:V/A-type H+-transporting ATPase subunit I
MLRPERMSRASVAGSKAVLADVVEELHDMNLVHVTDYDGTWEGFENGSPLEGSDEVSGKLVQVRAVINTLGVEDDDYDEEEGPGFETRDELYDRLEDLRERVNELEDERDEIRDSLRDEREKYRSIEPFVPLGIDLELLHGYDEIEVAVGQGNAEEVRDALDVETDEYEIFEGDGTVAVAARGVDLEDILVGVDFSELEVPDAEGSPEEVLEEIEESIDGMEEDLEEIESDMDEIRDEHANFLLAAEEELSIEAEKTEAPLSFATTANSFYAEGWIPEDRYDEMESKLTEAVGESVDVQSLETVEYDGGHPEEESEQEEEEPPVVQDNPTIANPFELLVNTVNHPKYSELDPTLIVFLTFPFAFGFMIGDMGYGLIYVAMGYGLYKAFDSDALGTLGIIGIWSGAFTFLFGYLYGEMFGLHLDVIGPLGNLPLLSSFDKGIHAPEVALTWLAASILFGLLHLNIGYVFGFINSLSHGLKEAVLEDGSWLMVLNGFFIWVFSVHAAGQKPTFLVGEEAVLNSNEMFSLGFTGFPAEVGLAGLVIAAVGAVMLVYAEGVIGAIEMPTDAFGHVLSYLRIMAVLLAKAGMAFVVNLLVFGAYESHGETHFMLPGIAGGPAEHSGEVLFSGLVWMGLEGSVLVAAVALLGALVVFAVGHVVVLLLGITAAGIQMIRLEYVEFFGKFYEGGGDKFESFGTDRNYTKEGN